MCVADSVVEQNRFHACFTSRNVIGQLVGKEFLALASDETFRMACNDFTLRVIGVVEKQMRFTPTGFSLDSRADENASEWAFNITNSKIERLHGATVIPWRSINDFSNATFNSMLTTWPGNRQ